MTLAKDGYTKEIAVPSKMYTAPSEAYPLAGKRISLKDCFQLAGIKTTMMNRAWSVLHPPEKESAEFVKLLVQLGAVIVGKTKMCSFASGEEPPDEWIEFQCPFNPRADGAMTPSGSTTGGAAALAGYEWLDASVGIDCRFAMKSRPHRLILWCSHWEYHSSRPTQRPLRPSTHDGHVALGWHPYRQLVRFTLCSSYRVE